MPSDEPTTLFSFGYWGWGNATRELVCAVDAVEAARGFAPPLFVDTRMSRSVRAKGFNGEAFQQTVGGGRYRWMNGLGNEAIKKRGGPPIQIKNPDDADILFSLAQENARYRRLIFFCSCEWPRTTDGRCHRTEVASLVLQCAKRQGEVVEVVEWPGGTPRVVHIPLSEADFRKSRKAKAIPLNSTLPRSDLLELPWASIADIHTSRDSRRHFVGPARFRGGRWVLPKLTDDLGRELLPADNLDLGGTWRKRWAFEPRKSFDAWPRESA